MRTPHPAVTGTALNILTLLLGLTDLGIVLPYAFHLHALLNVATSR